MKKRILRFDRSSHNWEYFISPSGHYLSSLFNLSLCPSGLANYWPELKNDAIRTIWLTITDEKPRTRQWHAFDQLTDDWDFYFGDETGESNHPIQLDYWARFEFFGATTLYVEAEYQ